MPDIKPFCALIPAPHLLAQVVTRPLENYGAGEAKLIASENSFSFLHLINPELDNPYLRGTRQELVYKKIGENLDGFLEDGVLLPDPSPSVYIYRVIHDGFAQTGIWTLTATKDYLEGRIKKHEHTVERRERLLADYLQHTGLDANPVLVTYHPDAMIDGMIARYVLNETLVDLTYIDGSRHKIWGISDPEDLQKIITAFGNMPHVYIADGHHRAASMAKTGLCTHFSTVYMNTHEVKVLEFNRLVRDLGDMADDDYLKAVGAAFDLEPRDTPVVPKMLHEMGMYFDGQWYRLSVKQGVFNENDPVDLLDVMILQKNILKPILHIKDPRTDARITFEGGRTPVSALQKQVDNGLYAVAFTLFPTSVEQLINVADANGIMPPKSTWVEPKFLVGLLTRYFK